MAPSLILFIVVLMVLPLRSRSLVSSQPCGQIDHADICTNELGCKWDASASKCYSYCFARSYADFNAGQKRPSFDCNGAFAKQYGCIAVVTPSSASCSRCVSAGAQFCGNGPVCVYNSRCMPASLLTSESSSWSTALIVALISVFLCVIIVIGVITFRFCNKHQSYSNLKNLEDEPEGEPV